MPGTVVRGAITNLDAKPKTGKTMLALAMEDNRGQGGVLDIAEPAGPCPRVLAFNGSVWWTYLAGYCANDVSVGPDGSVWANVHSKLDDPGRAGLCRIVPGTDVNVTP